MARNSVVARPCRLLLRHLLRNKRPPPCSPSTMARSSWLSETLISSQSQSPAVPSKSFSSSSFNSTTITSPNFQHFRNCRTLCSSPSSSSGPSNVVPIKSEVEFKNALSKAQDESLPAIFYFTAVWCGPCRMIAPKVIEWSKEYPHVTIYKIDLDEDDIKSTASKLDISAVPTFLFFQNGKQASKVIGASTPELIDTMKRLYKTE